MEPFEGNEEERERWWSERELGGSVHGGAAGTERLRPTYMSKEPLTLVRRRGEGGGALCAGNRTAVAWRRRNAAAEARASDGERSSRSGSPEK
jgi:hypothetical protein